MAQELSGKVAIVTGAGSDLVVGTVLAARDHDDVHMLEHAIQVQPGLL